MILMKSKPFFLEKLFLVFSVILNFLIFFITYINYSSHRGTDFGIYGNYIRYFLYSENFSLREQTVGYFSIIAKFTNLKKDTLLISVEYEDLIFNYGIQIGNYFLFLIGLLGIYKILIFLGLSKISSFTLLNLLSLFPPLIGMRMILKPEIMAFAFLPWVIYMIILYKQNFNKILLILMYPMIPLLMSIKASVTLMVGLTILLFFGKDVFKKEVLFLGTISLITMFVLISESFQITNLYLWEHKGLEGYDNAAPFSFLYSFNQELFTNPYRNSQSTSMWGILLLDTFGDYWQRYWFHKDGYFTNQYPGNRDIINFGIIFSLIFYLGSIYYLLKEKKVILKKIGASGYIGILVLIINAMNLFPFLGKNFNPSKGDPIKTHYFSFLLVFTFIYLFIKFFKGKKEIYSLLFLLVMIFFSFKLINPPTLEVIKDEQTLLNKVHLLSPCFLGDPANSLINYSHSWCSEEELLEAICFREYDENLLPVKENDYFIFPKDEVYGTKNLVSENNVVTIANYFECLNYVEGGYIPQSVESYFSDYKAKTPFVFNFIFLISLFSIFYIQVIKKYFKHETF